AGYTDAVVHRFEIKTNTGKPGGVHIRITAARLSAGARSIAWLASGREVAGDLRIDAAEIGEVVIAL
ncbi:hypothetical protein KUT65_43320, partial [Pseudomonas aeruginosa]|nr:hypothetical protein [Pseudomonas aeruginosa]